MTRSMDDLVASRPILVGVRRAGEALNLARHELLHAGPPLLDPCRPPPPMASSIVMTCIHEGWANDEPEAEALLREGVLRLSPAQERSCVTPLAAIVGPGTPLFEVRESGGAVVYAPVSAVRGADTRMGSRDSALLSRLQIRDQEIAPAWHSILQDHGPLELLPCAAHGLANGDDLHSRTTAANDVLAVKVRERGDANLADAISATPLFFLTLWMAAASCMLRAAEGGDIPTLVTRAGGNGERFAIALSSDPARWHCCDATSPQGSYVANAPKHAVPVGAIGDSAVIDMLGLGGQRLAHAPEPLSLVNEYLPEHHDESAQSLLRVPHPALPGFWPLGLDAQRVVEQQYAPFVMLAMIAQDGFSGFLGRGIYRPPLALFESAV